MNQSPKHNLNTVDEVVDDIIDKLDLRGKVDTAYLSENDLAILQTVLTRYIGERLDQWSINEELYQNCIRVSDNESLDKTEAATVILNELWSRLKKTYKLRIV